MQTRVLVVDDNADLRSMLVHVLQHAGYVVETAADGTQALERQRNITADVLITDIFMPDGDGIETIEAFRKSYPGIRIIAMSGGGRRLRNDYLEISELLGVDATLRKPFRPEMLLHALRSLLPPD